MKTAGGLFVALGLVLLLSSCFMSNPWRSGGDGDSAYLPPDTINDTARSYSGPFKFETLLPVSLNLEIDFYELDADGLGAKIQQTVPEAGKAVVVITDSDGNAVYEGAVQADGTLEAELALPAAPEDMVLTVKAQGYQERSVTIHDLVNYSRIERTMGLMSEGSTAKGQVMPDSDSDGVPDVYDAFPSNPDLAFTVRIPDDKWLTVAFEDLYLEEGAGDGDYNDFLAFYSLTEFYDADNRLVKIEGEAKAEVKIAGYNHEFGIAIGYEKEQDDDFTVSIDADYFDERGNMRSTSLDPRENFREPFNSTYKNKAVIPLFESTKDALGKTASFVVSFSSPIDRDKVEPAPYDPYLYVHNTGYDVHLIGKDPLPDTNNPPSSYANPTGDSINFLDEVGFPWALLVPADWQHPEETQFIEELYPFFKYWREDKGASNSNWYLRPMDPDNDPPNPVSVVPSAIEFVAGLADTQERKLLVKMGDPNGDLVTLLWSETPEYLDIGWKEDTGDLVATVMNAPAGELTVYFWSLDEHGASSEYKPFPVKFTFVEGTKTYERILIDTFSPDGSLTADTYIDLFGSAGDPDADDPWTGDDTGDAIAFDDNGNTNWPGTYARIDYTGGLEAGTYYIRVRGATEEVDDFYAIRVLSLQLSDPIPGYDTFPGTDFVSPDALEPDDEPISGGVPIAPVPIALGQTISRSIHAGDIDWFVLVLE
jgi:LruC domain-containing protein